MRQRVEEAEQRRAAGGVRRDCAHKVAAHQHGTHAAYVLDKCRCAPCSTANREYERNRSRQKVYGRWQPFVDAGPSRRHIQKLRAQGLGLKRIALLSGVPHGALSKLVYGWPRADGRVRRTRRIRVENAAAILAVSVSKDTLGSRVSVDPTETRIQLQQLIALGWSKRRLALKLGMQESNFGAMMQRAAIGAGTARAVGALYDELRDVDPPATTHRQKISVARAKRYAAERGWRPPFPRSSAEPQPAGTADIVGLTKAGMSDDEIAERLDITALEVRHLRLLFSERRAS